MIDIKRAVLYGLLMVVVYALWMNWQKDYPAQPKATVIFPVKQTDENKQNLEEEAPVPSASVSSTEKDSLTAAPDVLLNKEKIEFVRTDVLNIGIDLSTGDIVKAELLDYKQSLENSNPFILLNNHPDSRYVASTRLFSIENNTLKNVKVVFSQDSYRVEKKDNQWIVTLEGKTPENIQIEKTFILTKGQYLIEQRYLLKNKSEKIWKGSIASQFSRYNPDEDKSSLFHLGSYAGGSVSIPNDKLYKKISFSDMKKENFDQSVKGGWVAMQQHYFLTALIPPVGETSKFYTQFWNNTYTIGSLGNLLTLNPKQFVHLESQLYIGPELTDVLKKVSPGLELTVDYGWLSVISMFLFWILKWVHHYVGNWGWAIVIVTLLIKLAFYRLSEKSYLSMANMRKLQPKLAALKERFGDDKAKLSQATMELYRKEKVNPLGGCLPIVVQIPVFIALYWVLLESVQLRQAPFIFWIHDLSLPDPYYILPIVMGLTMLIQQKLNPPPPDPAQAKMMMFLPVIFTGLFLHFPAGLVLYWVINNALSILQQWYITRKVEQGLNLKKLAKISK